MKKFSEIFDKRYLIRVLTALLTALFAFGVIFYISYHIADPFKEELSLLNATTKTVLKTISTDAYLFRDEVVLKSTGGTGGSVTPAVHNGEKVSAYEKVADIYNNTSPDVENRIAEIDKQILMLEQSQNEDVSVLSSAGLDSEIFGNVEKIRMSSENGNFSDALAYRTELLVSIKKREILTGNVTNFTEQIRALEMEKSELTARLGDCLESVYSSVAGYYYADVDGYEGILTAKALDGITYDDMVRLMETEPDADHPISAGKIATDFRWYIACPMTKAEAAEFQTRARYDVTFAYNNKTLKMRLFSVISEPSGTNAVVVFECESLPYNFDYARMQPVQICTADYTGFEVPISAIRIVDGMEGVFVLDEVTVDFRRVNIVYEYDGKFLCTGNPNPDPMEDGEESSDDLTPEYGWIDLNDIIITEGKDLKVGKVISARR